MWAIDTAASVNLVNSKTSGAIRGYNASTVMLDTVNGPAKSTVSADVEVPGIPQVMSAAVMDDTPNCVSAGRLILDYGYELHWTKEAAWLTRPDGSNAELLVQDYVTYLPKQEELDRCKAAGAVSTVDQIEAILERLPIDERHKLIGEFTKVYDDFLDVWCDYKGVGSVVRRRLETKGPIPATNVVGGSTSSKVTPSRPGSSPDCIMAVTKSHPPTNSCLS